MRTLFIPIISFVFIFLSFNGSAQSLGKGAVSFSGEVDGVYFNVSGDLKFEQFVVHGSSAYIKVNWNWMKVNHIEYNGVLYDSNHNLIEANFDYLKSGFNGVVELKDYIPTKLGFQSQEQTVYPGSGANYSFDMDKETWDEMDADGRSKIRAEWEKKPFALGVTLKSINGAEIKSIIYKVKERHKELKAAEEKEKKFYTLIDEGERAIANSDYDEAIAKYQKARDLNVRNDLADQRLTQARELKEEKEQEEVAQNELSMENESREEEKSSNQEKSSDEKEKEERNDTNETEENTTSNSTKQQSEQNQVTQSAANQYLNLARKAEANGDLDRAISYYEKAYAEEPNYSTTVKINSLKQQKSVNRLNNTIEHYSQQYERNRERARQMVAEMEKEHQDFVERKKAAYYNDKTLYEKEYRSYVINFDKQVEQNPNVSNLKNAVLEASNGEVIYFTSVELGGPNPDGFAGGSWEGYEIPNEYTNVSELRYNQRYYLKIYQKLREIVVSDDIKNNIDEFEYLFLSKNCVDCNGKKKFFKNSIIASKDPISIFDYLTNSFGGNLQFARIFSETYTQEIGSAELSSKQRNQIKFSDVDIEWVKKENDLKRESFNSLSALAEEVLNGSGFFLTEQYGRGILIYYNKGKYVKIFIDQFYESRNLNISNFLTENPYKNAWDLLVKRGYSVSYAKISGVKEKMYTMNYNAQEKIYDGNTGKRLWSSDYGNFYWTEKPQYFAYGKMTNKILTTYCEGHLPRIILETGTFEYDGESIYDKRRASNVIVTGISYSGNYLKKKGGKYIYETTKFNLGWHRVPRRYYNDGRVMFEYEEKQIKINQDGLDKITYPEWAKTMKWSIPDFNNGVPIKLGGNPNDFNSFFNAIEKNQISYFGREFNVSF